MWKNHLSLIIILAVVITVAVFFSTFPRHELPELQQPNASTSIKGVVESIAPESKTINVFTSKGLHVSVSYDDATVFRNTNGIAVDQSIIQTGVEVTTIGIAANSYSLRATSILISQGSVDTRPVQPDNVFEESVIPNTYSITGMAQSSWFSESSFPIIVRDAHGTLIDRAHAYAQTNMKADTLIPFTAWLSFDDPVTATGTIVFEKNNPSGLPENDARISIPIKFATQANTSVVKLYYPNTRKASELSDVCSPAILLPVRRNIPITDSPIRDTISLLLQGKLTDEETRQGFTSDFPHDDFVLRSSALATDGTLTLEFSSVPGFTSGGACHVGVLAEEIKKTALQFPSVKKVIFKPDTLFQP